MTLFDTFESLSLTDINDYVASRQEENLHLEFKTVADPRFERDDRKNLARAIAGFANSDGGIIIWGLATAKDVSGVEYVTGIQPIAPLATFMAKLNQLTGEACNPSVSGVVHRKIVTVGDAGVAVTFVPASDVGPHMAKCGEDRYYRRSGDRFARMEHFEVADMFGRRPQPHLEFYQRLAKGSTGGGPGGSWAEVIVFLGIRNYGRGTAKALYLALLVRPPYGLSRHGIDGNGRFGLELLPVSEDSAWSRFGGGDGRYVYPGTELDVASVTIEIPEQQKRSDTLRVEYQLAADGVALTVGTARVDGRQLVTTVWPDDDA